MSVLRIDASIQGPRSASSELADLAEAEWSATRPGTTFVRRHLGAEPLPADTWAAAIHGGFTAEGAEGRRGRRRQEWSFSASSSAALRALGGE